MNTILFLNFHFGDVIGSSGNADWFKFGFPIFVSVGIVIGQRMWDKLKKQNEQLLKLYNFNHHISRILNRETKFVAAYNQVVEDIKREPFDDLALRSKVVISDFKRMLEIDKTDIFTAFIKLYDKAEGADRFLEVYNLIEFYQTVSESITERYNVVSEQIFQDKHHLYDQIVEVDELYRALLKEENKKEVKGEWFAILLEIHKQHDDAIDALGENRETLNFKIVNLIRPIFQKLRPRYDDERITDLFVLCKRILHHRHSIADKTKQLGDYIDANMNKMMEVNLDLRRINQELIKKLKYKEPKNTSTPQLKEAR